ncbi:hypothetical protein ACGGKE_03505 [Sphingobium naphthae]|uniref:hypothetical protein n=1 Tax=Sphingobium naphthae TaxID=1886786 RepID=UPI003748C008
MSRIPHVHRFGARYAYRRRIHFRNIISRPITVSLRTADPVVARRRAAMLSACFVIVKAKVDSMLETGPALTGQQIDEIFRVALENELNSLLDDAYRNAPWSESVTDVAAEIAAACRNLRRPNRPLSPATSWREVPPDPSEHRDLDGADFYAAQIVANLGDDQVAAILQAVGAPVHTGILELARMHIIRGMGKGAELAQRAFDDDVLAAPDPALALVAATYGRSPDEQILLSRPNLAPPPVQVPAAPPQPDSYFFEYEPRRFSEVIDEVIAELRADKIWKVDTSQQRRIMMCFAWVTGDRPLGAYNHLDAGHFKKCLQKIPKDFQFGTFEEGPMSRPFDEVLAAMPPLTPQVTRSNKTVNRDLSFMGTVSKRLATSYWRPKFPGALVLDFAAERVKITESEKDDLRPPWKREHMDCLFRSPLYLGGGRDLHRLRDDGRALRIWHDAAYFAPLIWYYSSACREEICGLELADITVDHPTPHFEIRDNLTRGRDGEMRGLKRAARHRHLPIHPELIRLGFLDYVEAIRKERHVALFPELYRQSEKRGGAFFYERAWQHMADYIGDRLPVRVNKRGKGPDIHSIRSLGSSFYEVEGANENIRADVMGHARKSVNGISYSKRIETEGLDVVLAERQAFILKYVPVLTEHIPAAPINLLPLDQRSRVGSSRNRKTRSDAGTK